MISTAAMPPLLMRSDFDPVQVAIIVMAVVFGFIKWLWENWQQKRESSARNAEVDPEEQRLREAAWRRQTGQDMPPPVPQTPVGPVQSPWAEVRKAWEELKDATQRPVMPRHAGPAAKPPPVPVHPSVRRSVAPGAVPAAILPDAESRFRVRERGPVASAPEDTSAVGGAMLAGLRGMRHEPALLRQAILMQEIIGPPKALQTSEGPAI